MQTVVRMQTVKLHPGRRYQLLTSGLRGKLHSLFGGFSEVLMGYRSVEGASYAGENKNVQPTLLN